MPERLISCANKKTVRVNLDGIDNYRASKLDISSPSQRASKDQRQ